VSLVELIRRYNMYTDDAVIDDSKLEQMVVAALGHNLGLLAYEKRVYESQEEYSVEDKRQLREHYPQQSADILKAAGLDQPLIQDVVRRTSFIYAGIACHKTCRPGKDLSITRAASLPACLPTKSSTRSTADCI
jgi:hypothetical protein